ncbi:MAG: hypothetical protein CL908_09915 [Deltaproteobacteria bacterium]|nr:hypothetical protein [Deltaproteobacteria bacterium]
MLSLARLPSGTHKAGAFTEGRPENLALELDEAYIAFVGGFRHPPYGARGHGQRFAAPPG